MPLGGQPPYGAARIRGDPPAHLFMADCRPKRSRDPCTPGSVSLRVWNPDRPSQPSHPEFCYQRMWQDAGMWATLRQRKWLSCCPKNSSNHVSTCLGECDETFSFIPLPEFIMDHKIFNTIILKFKHKYKNLLVIYCVQVNRATQGNGSLDSFI